MPNNARGRIKDAFIPVFSVENPTGQPANLTQHPPNPYLTPTHRTHPIRTNYTTHTDALLWIPHLSRAVPRGPRGRASCDGGRGTCKYTSDCHAPAYTHIIGLCPGPTNYQCCIPTGCVVCGAAEEERDLESRIPCC
ncbi:hypothetical protein FB451DRAFT_1402704 [Mycena latifolia]|nr:hypothetical protein FB451DRAFT_1402704 [Mycena latifolia]